MPHVLETLFWIVGGLALAVLLGWLGANVGRWTARKYPSATAALWMLSVFLKIDPPPPPKAERVTKNEETAGDPPKV